MLSQINCIISDFEEVKKKKNYNNKDIENLLKWYHSEKIEVRGNYLIVNDKVVYEYFG